MRRRTLPVISAVTSFAVATRLALFVHKQRRRTRRYAIAESSMEPALTPGDYVIVRRSGGRFLLGDVVIFAHPQRAGFEMVKRVVGLPGTTVRIDSGRVLIDDARLPEPWASPDSASGGPWNVGHDEVFVLGDHRERSSGDSRSLGPLPASAVQWTVRARYRPLRRIGWV